MELLTGLTVPLLGTTIGAAMVFLVRDRISDFTNKAMLGFASGVMVAASFWSLLQPALEQTGNSSLQEAAPVIIGFLVGMGFLLALDTFIPHQHIEDNQPEGPRSALPRSTKMMLAVALHNIPEGMAVGVVFAGIGDGSGTITFAAALALAIGMAVQNIPEGAIISMPLHSEEPRKGIPVRSTLRACGTCCGCRHTLFPRRRNRRNAIAACFRRRSYAICCH